MERLKPDLHRADTTDVAMDANDGQENAEEEAPTSDPEISPGDTTTLLENLRGDQNRALAGERWNESSQLQQAIVVLLDATSVPNPDGLIARADNNPKHMPKTIPIP